MATVDFDGYNAGMLQKRDKAWKITIETQELAPESVAKLAHFSGQFVKILMSDEKVSNEMIMTFEAMEVQAETGSKTPSKRVRDRLFIWWKTMKDQGLTDAVFDTFYLNRMENIIEWIQQKIDAIKIDDEPKEYDHADD
jgi:hypothetical protein